MTGKNSDTPNTLREPSKVERVALEVAIAGAEQAASDADEAINNCGLAYVPANDLRLIISAAIAAMETTAPSTGLSDAVARFLAKYDECEPHLADAFLHRELRCGQYTGPDFAGELAELRTALNSHGPQE